MTYLHSPRRPPCTGSADLTAHLVLPLSNKFLDERRGLEGQHVYSSAMSGDVVVALAMST